MGLGQAGCSCGTGPSGWLSHCHETPGSAVLGERMRILWAEVREKPLALSIPCPVLRSSLVASGTWHVPRHGMWRCPRKVPQGCRRNLPFPLGLGKCRTRELLMPGQSDSGSCVLTGTFDLGAVPGLVASGTHDGPWLSLHLAMLAFGNIFLPDTAPASSSIQALGTGLGLLGPSWDVGDLPAMLGTVWLLGMEEVRHLLSLWCHGADPVKHPMYQEIFDGAGGFLYSWMSWHCPEGGLVRLMSSSWCGDSGGGNRTWKAGAGSGGGKWDVPVQSVPLQNLPGQRGFLGGGDDPRLRVTITSGKWPPQGDGGQQMRNGDHQWRWVFATDREGPSLMEGSQHHSRMAITSQGWL